MQNRTQGDSDRERWLWEVVQQQLREFGITLRETLFDDNPDHGVDAVVTLTRGDAVAAYSVQMKAPMTLTALARRPSAGPLPLLVIGDHISRRSADAFREANVQFIDASGNAFITFDGVFVDVRGRAEQPVSHSLARPARGDTRRAANLFSRGRAQIILALLSWPELAGRGRREIAAASGTSLGQAHDVLVHLEDAGYLLLDPPSLTRRDELLDLWTTAYGTGLGPRLEVAQFHGDLGRPIDSDGPVYLSSESARGTDIARPASLTVYLDSWDSQLAIANRWSTNPDRVRNVFVRRKFWVSPRPVEEEAETRIRNAPWPLVYADLMTSGDARLAEVARTWRAGHARSDQG